MTYPGDTSHLRFLEAVTIGPTSGGETFAKSNNVIHHRFIEPEFERLMAGQSRKQTPEQDGLIYQAEKDGTYANLFGSFGTDLHALCWQEGQSINFCQLEQSFPNQSDCATFFLFDAGPKLFVGNFYFKNGKIYIITRPFSFDGIWEAKYHDRLVIPELK